jgi:hypothetical protein
MAMEIGIAADTKDLPVFFIGPFRFKKSVCRIEMAFPDY